MSNQMKKVLITFLIMSYLCVFCMALTFCLNGFVFDNIINYFVFGFSLAIAIYLHYLYLKIKKEDNEFNEQLFYAKKLLDLRQKALLDFYLKNGILPQYDKDGKLKDIDEMLGILTKLDEHGLLTPSVYEILGIKPTMTVDGKELPTIFVLKHLMKPLKTKDFDKIKKYHKLVAKQENKKEAGKAEEKGKKKDEKAKVSSASGIIKLKKGKVETRKPLPVFSNMLSGSGKKSEKSGAKGIPTKGKIVVGKDKEKKAENKKSEQKDNNIQKPKVVQEVKPVAPEKPNEYKPYKPAINEEENNLEPEKKEDRETNFFEC